MEMTKIHTLSLILLSLYRQKTVRNNNENKKHSYEVQNRIDKLKKKQKLTNLVSKWQQLITNSAKRKKIQIY